MTGLLVVVGILAVLVVSATNTGWPTYDIADPAWGVAMERAPDLPHETILGLVDGCRDGRLVP